MIEEAMGSSNTIEVASFGMSLDRLKHLLAVEDARAHNKKQLLATGSSSSKATRSTGLSLELVERADQVVLLYV